MVTAEAEIFEKKSRPPEVAAMTGSSLRILVAEDNAVNLCVLEGMLMKLGHQITSVGNGLEALSAVQSDSFDVVLMDCQMPKMDGYDATRAIREWEADKGRDPNRIIALTANAMAKDRQKCLRAGMDDYLSKPVTIAQLTATLAANTQDSDSCEPSPNYKRHC
jgi:CheY-like chemotaxis protein